MGDAATGTTGDVEAALAVVTAGLPGGGEPRPGQVAMATAVGRAIEGRRHLVVQAGTGTGKSLAYLVPAVLSGRTVVVATATKALQDQLAGKDIPLVAEALGDVDFTAALLKGRSNYLCRQRAAEIGGRGEQLSITTEAGAAGLTDAGDELPPPVPEDRGSLGDQVRRLLTWAGTSSTGDRAELEFEPSPRAWAMVSMTARDCPGAFRCPSGHDCFAESARARAAEADVVVVNTHLYGAHVASGGSVLPDHDVVVFDEAHEVEEVMTDSLGLDIGPGRFRSLATAVRPLLPTAAADRVAGLVEVAEALESALRPLAGRRVPPGGLDPPGPDDGSGAGDPLARALALAGTRVALVAESLRRSAREGDAGAGPDGGARRARLDRALLAAGHLADDLARLPGLGDDHVAWVEDGGNRPPSLRISPIEVGPILAGALWEHVTSVLTSATVPLHLAGRLGLPDEDTDEADVGSPFDYRTHAVLYVAADLPDRRTPAAEPAILDEIEALITAAGGRTLALFTSWRAMHAARSTLAERLPFRVLAQSDLPKPALVEAFAADEATCLFATLGFWQGVDVPGRTLSLVTIDRIPFPRPDDPVLEARRERAGAGAFRLVDLPRAGTLLAQGAGRLIRSAADQGVVAILDSRLATARYRGELLARVPPMHRSISRPEAEAFLRRIAAGG